MPTARDRIYAQDKAVRAIRLAAHAEPNTDVAALMAAIAAGLARKWGVREEPTP